MGQILTVVDLSGIADAAVRAIKWCTYDFSEEIGVSIERFIADMNAQNGNILLCQASIPAGMQAAHGSWTEGKRQWHQHLWASDEWESVGDVPTWCFSIGVDDESVDWDVHLWHQLPNGEPFTIVLGSDRRDRAKGLTPAPRMLAWAKKHPHLFPDSRRTLQAVDGYMRGVRVTIDPDWSTLHLKNSVVAQIIEWIIRVGDFSHARLPELEGDVYKWWAGWVKQAAPSPSDPSLSDAFEIAKRSVRPETSAGHRAYWKKSLRVVGPDLVGTAAKDAGISRRTAYNRLKRAGASARDFLEATDPVAALADFLNSQAPKSQLSSDRSALVDQLENIGMRRESARKFERRIRGLPESVQAERVRKAMKRLGRR